MLKNFWQWVRPSLQGPDGNASHRKLTVFTFVSLIVFMVLSVAAWGIVYPEIAWVIVSGGAGIFSGLNVWQSMENKKKDENREQVIIKKSNEKNISNSKTTEPSSFTDA